MSIELVEQALVFVGMFPDAQAAREARLPRGRGADWPLPLDPGNGWWHRANDTEDVWRAAVDALGIPKHQCRVGLQDGRIVATWAGESTYLSLTDRIERGMVASAFREDLARVRRALHEAGCSPFHHDTMRTHVRYVIAQSWEEDDITIARERASAAIQPVRLEVAREARVDTIWAQGRVPMNTKRVVVRVYW